MQQKTRKTIKATSNGAKRVLRERAVFLPKMKVRARRVAARLEHRRVEGKRK